MSETIQINGRCLCGAVTVTAAKASKSVGACHCNWCRYWGGGPFLAIDGGTQVEFAGEENIGVFNSSEWAERGFCKQCGSHLFYRLKATGQHILPVGLFQEAAADWVLDHQVFIDEKPAYYSFSQNTEDLTGPELFAKFGAE